MTARRPIDRTSTGQPTIDAVLGGGLPTNSIALIAGAPGAGKTMLAQQMAFHVGTPDRPALIVTTMNEPLDKVVRFGQELAFFDRKAVGSRVIYESAAEALARDGLSGLIDRLVVLLSTLRPGLLIIDSFRALSAFAPEPEYRRFVAEIGQRIAATAVTSVWVGEYQRDLLETPEAAVADVIVQLRSERIGPRRLRTLEVLKVRGGGFLAGEHGYRLGPRGLEVSVRLADAVDTSPVRLEAGRISLGQPRLDEMIGGGAWPGTSTLVIGASGTGKTILSLDFLNRGARDGRSGVFATLQESQSQLARVRWAGGAPPDDHIHFHHRSPVDIDIDEWVGELFEVLDARRAELLVIDSVSDLRLASREDKRFEEYVYSLSQRLSQRGVTTLLTLEAPPSIGITQLPASPLSSIADNIILLGYRIDGNRVGRAIYVLKSRASGHDDTIRGFEITGDGPSIGESLTLPPDTAGSLWTSRLEAHPR